MVISTTSINGVSLRRLLKIPMKERLPEVVLLANAEDERTGAASEIYAFKKPAGRFGMISVPRDQAHDPKALATAIIARNGLLPRDPAKAAQIVERASKQEPKEYRLHVSTEGWQPKFAGFVHRGRIFGYKDGSQLVRKPPIETRPRQFPLSTRGTIEGWHDIARRARYSSRMRMVISAAFAAPLLRLMDMQSFMIILAGRSKVGKSTAQLAGGAVIGIGTEGKLPNFNATAAALQELAIEFNDRVLLANEIGAMRGARSDLYQTLRPLTYQYAEGRETVRHSKSTYASESTAHEWRGIMIASSENTLERLAALAHCQRDEGERARAFDVPALREGRLTIFDSRPKRVPEREEEDWTKREMVEIRKLCSQHHGMAFDNFVEFLSVKEPSYLRIQVEKHINSFNLSLKNIKLSGVTQHVERYFALLYAGAMLAKEAGLLKSWGQKRTLGEIKKCFLDGLEEIKEVESILDTVKSRLALLLNEKVKPWSAELNFDKIDGWYKHDGENKTFYVKTKTFRRWFPKKEELIKAVHFLLEEGVLITKDRNKISDRNTGWATTFYKPARKNFRVYQFREPVII